MRLYLDLVEDECASEVFKKEGVAILSGNTDLLEKAKLDNRIMQLEKEPAKPLNDAQIGGSFFIYTWQFHLQKHI